MAVADVVTILTEYCEDGEEAFRDLHGPEAVIAVRDLIDLLQRELGGQLEYGTLWDAFEAAPRETAPDLTGALEAIVEADPGLGEQLEVLLAAYYATGQRGGATVAARLPQSAESEFLPREEARIEDHEVEPRSHADVAGEGTYLYGNVRAGDEITVDTALEMGPDVLAVHRELEMLSFDVDELFEQLRATVERESALSDQVKGELRAELEELQVEIMLGEEADEERMVHHLRRIGDLDPDVLELLLTGLQHTRSKARAMVQNAIRRTSG
jgi:hypothetical protein